MKSNKVNTERRKLFARFGIGALSAGLMSVIPAKLFSGMKSEEKKSAQSEQSKKSVSISINPNAVKRTKRLK